MVFLPIDRVTRDTHRVSAVTILLAADRTLNIIDKMLMIVNHLDSIFGLPAS